MTTRLITVLLLLAGLGSVASWTGVAAQEGRPECTTFDANNEPSSAFRGGDQIIVRGTGFGSRSLVFVRFEQGSRNAELARANANDLGAFATQPAPLPATVEEGTATIRALDARGAGTCQITMSLAEGAEEGGLGRLYAVWGAALALFGVILGVMTYRWWKSERLKEAMGRFGAPAETPPAAPRDPGPPASPAPAEAAPAPRPSERAWELDQWEAEALEVRRATEPAPVPESPRPTPPAPAAPAPADPVPAPSADPVPAPSAAAEVEWFDPDEDPGSVQAADEEPQAMTPPPEPPEPERPSPPEPEPPGWETGRAPQRTSEAIDRLRREVRTWRS